MNFKYLILSWVILVDCSLAVEDFTLPKGATSETAAPNRLPAGSAKKSREAILDQIVDILKALLERDSLSLDLRTFFQNELEISLCSDELSLISSSSKARLQEILKLLQDISQLLTEIKNKEAELKVKIKDLKTGKLKG